MNRLADWAHRALATFVVGLLLVATSAAASTVLVNGRALSPGQVQEFEQTYGSPPTPGAYWYDATSGLFGQAGAGAVGRLRPGHPYGPLAATASAGTTGVFLNGRQLPAAELRVYQLAVGPVAPGRYWLDAAGNAGREGHSQPLVNLFGALAKANGAGNASSAPTAPGVDGAGTGGAPAYTDSEGYTWHRHLFDCQLVQGPARLVLEASYIKDVGIIFDTSKRPRAEISGVVGLDQQIRYLRGEFRLAGQVHRFKGRGSHFSIRETLDNSMSGRFELNGSQLLVYYPFNNPTPGVCTPKH